MRNFQNYLKILISATVLAILLPFLWNCADYDPNGGRFWLLEPNINNQRSLLPFTYTSDLYYGWGEYDTAYQVENVKNWQTMLGGNIAAKDIHQALYYLSSDDFFAKKYSAKNTFLATLKKPNNARYWSYFIFAKGCENVFAVGDWESNTKTTFVKEQINIGKKLLTENAKDANLGPRIAYFLIKLHRLNKQESEAKALFTQYFTKNTQKNWLNAAVFYQNSQLQTDPKQVNIWLAKAWDAGFHQKIWMQQAFHKVDLEASIKTATEPRDKATICLIPATHEPGPALNALQRAYGFDPMLPDLAKLMSREVNKLENWLLSPTLYGGPARIEQPYIEEEKRPKYDSVAQLKTDLAHLHACRAFAQKVITENKRDDMPFWHLSGAHLAYLDKDFKETIDLAEAGVKLKTAPMNQKIQLHLISILAEIGDKGAISEATENKIPIIFKAIEQNETAFEDHLVLKEKLATLLSDQFKKRNEIAKSAFLMGKTTNFTPNLGYMESGVLFEKLLTEGKPADFDRAVQMITNPKTDFERWFASEPHRYHTQMDYDEKTQSLKLAKGEKTTWDIEKLYELKAMYYTRQDQLDSALMTLENVADLYWKNGNISPYDEHAYFKKNPFSVGINIDNLALTNEKNKQTFNKKSFLQKIIELRDNKEKDKQQEAFLLLGNAYYNMTYYGKDWWLMMKTDKSSGEVESYYNPEMSAIPEKPLPLNSIFYWSSLGLMATAFAGFSNKKGRKYLFFMLFAAFLVPFSCKKVTPAFKKELTVTNFDDVYYRCSLAKEWYAKAAQINPDNDLGIAATFMLGECEKHQQYFQFTRTKKDWNEEFVEKSNAFFEKIKGKTFKSVMSCSWLKEKL
jgi:hypothetical protein